MATAFIFTATSQALYNKSLDASGGSASRNLLGAAQGALIRAAASTPPLGLNISEVTNAGMVWRKCT